MLKKKTKRKKNIPPVKIEQHRQDAESEYRKTKIKTNIGFIFFSVLFTVCLFLPEKKRGQAESADKNRQEVEDESSSR